MNPMTLMALASLVSGAGSALTANKGKTSSSYGKGQLGAIDDVLQAIRGMRSGAQDITQSPGYQTGQEWLTGLFNNPQFFNQFEAPLQRQFQEQTVPDLANRFASMGTGGALGSTGFRNQLAREGSNLSTNIAALRGGMQQQAIPQLLGYAQQPFSNLMTLYNQALGHPTQNVYQPPSAGPFGGAFASLMGGYGQGFGQQFGQGMAGQNPSLAPGQSPTTV